MNNNLKPALEQWRNEQAEPVKQEPVAWWDADANCMAWNCLIDFKDKQPFYTLPVDAKAIRAEALEDAVKFLEENGMIAPKGFTAAAIRGLK